MTFNDNARINSSSVTRRGRGRRGGLIAGGGIGIVALLYLGSQLFGVNLVPLAPAVEQVFSGNSSASGEVEPLANCETGADANANVDCRMAATSEVLDRYWATQVDGYVSPGDVVLFTGATDSACGSASADTGPFYCPADESIYLDTSFFEVLVSDYGSNDGSLAQMYVLSHEWGHHVSHLIGSLNNVGQDSGPASGSVRLELQADCFAGAWVGDATEVTDDSGVPFLEPLTEPQIADALSAAAAVGDDRIMESAGVEVNPERFTHGSAEQRQRWFQTGQSDGPGACRTFDVGADEL